MALLVIKKILHTEATWTALATSLKTLPHSRSSLLFSIINNFTPVE